MAKNTSLENWLRLVEARREHKWRRARSNTAIRLRWKALIIRHCLHILPGQCILELGAGSGRLTAHLASFLKAENSITAAVFNSNIFDQQHDLNAPNTQVVFVQDLSRDLEAESFDFIIGSDVLSHRLLPEALNAIYKLLKPGGQLIFFEENDSNPIVAIKKGFASIGSLFGGKSSSISISRYQALRALTQQGFTHIEVLPFDIVPRWVPARFISLLQSKLLPFEHTPGISAFCNDRYLWAKKPGLGIDLKKLKPNLATHSKLFGSVSIVVPCHNEAMNISNLVHTLRQFYDAYIHEIIIVNDNSTDETSEVVRRLAVEDSRIKLLDREPPNGVGRALRDGYAAATGRYILSMDCDFVQIVPDLRDMFDAIAAGHDGAIGSRFTHESILINYPFPKLVCNRIFHLLIKVLLVWRARDLSNNLKLYRADIFKELQIEEPHFAANLETGLKPVLAGYDIEEVPMPWINRTVEMGASSFRILRVGPAYFKAMLRIIFRGRSSNTPMRSGSQTQSSGVWR